MNTSDMYRVLDLDPDPKIKYSKNEIKKAFRTAALKYHPDKNKEIDQDKMKEILIAYKFLMNESADQEVDQGSDAFGDAFVDILNKNNSVPIKVFRSLFEYFYDDFDDLSKDFSDIRGNIENIESRVNNKMKNFLSKEKHLDRL